jgi:hypothetical protein
LFPNGAETEVLVVGNIEYLRMPPERMGKKGKKRIPGKDRVYQQVHRTAHSLQGKRI